MSRIVIAGLENIAEQLGCSKKTLYKWIQQKNFPAFKMDGVWRAMPRDIEVWVDEQRQLALQGKKGKAGNKPGIISSNFVGRGVG